MNYDIVPIKRAYRGIDRALLATDLLTKRTKKKYNTLLERYFKYLDITQKMPSKSGLHDLICFCKELQVNDIACEIIAYSLSPLINLWGYGLDFLGIDIVHDMAESLLCECENKEAQKYLNGNGLCKSKEDVSTIVPLLDHGDVEWNPCYVYKVEY